MKSASKPDPLLDRQNLLDTVGRGVEEKFCCSARFSIDIAQECFRMADKTLGGVGIVAPNEFKVAGHNSFWIKKLKPFQTFSPVEEQPGPRHLMFNEAVAVLFGYSVIMDFGHTLPRDEKLLNDLIVSLRYNSISPSALVFIFEALAKVPPRPSP